MLTKKSSDLKIPYWQYVTREERYFTSVLHHEISCNVKPFSDLLCKRLQISAGVKISDVGFEVCFFRDGARKDIIERRKELEKQTFDFMFFLSDKSAVIIEAKAQQGYDNKQLNSLNNAKKIIEDSKKCPISKIYLVGLYSSKYKPKKTTLHNFSPGITWKELKEVYPTSKDVFERADSIYGK